MEEEIIALVEDYLDDRLQLFGQKWHEIPFTKGGEIGRTVDYSAGRNRYIGYLISLGVYSFKGMRIGLDCANGSAWNIAKAVFDALGAKTYVINNEPNGTNINTNCGSTHIGVLQQYVKEKGLDNNLLELIAADPAFNLTIEELQKSMDPSRYVGRAKEQTVTFIEKTVQPVLDAHKEMLGMTAEINV